MDNDTEQSGSHQRMAEKRNAGYEKKQAKATLEKGLVIVITGTGKGKTTSALGMGLRAVGHGMRLGVVQFIKGAKPTAERTLFEQFPNVDWFTIGDGFTWITQDRERDIATAQKAWAQAAQLIGDANYDMVILDELNTILKYEYVDVNEVLAVLSKKPAMQHVIITGRHAPDILIEVADLVSDIRPLKHPYKDQGVKGQKGIEF